MPSEVCSLLNKYSKQIAGSIVILVIWFVFFRIANGNVPLQEFINSLALTSIVGVFVFSYISEKKTDLIVFWLIEHGVIAFQSSIHIARYQYSENFKIIERVLSRWGDLTENIKLTEDFFWGFSPISPLLDRSSVMNTGQILSSFNNGGSSRFINKVYKTFSHIEHCERDILQIQNDLIQSSVESVDTIKSLVRLKKACENYLNVQHAFLNLANISLAFTPLVIRDLDAIVNALINVDGDFDSIQKLIDKEFEIGI